MNHNDRLLKEFARRESNKQKFNRIVEDEQLQKEQELRLQEQQKEQERKEQKEQKEREQKEKDSKEQDRKRRATQSSNKKKARHDHANTNNNAANNRRKTAADDEGGSSDGDEPNPARLLRSLPMNQRQTSIELKTMLDDLCNRVVKGTMEQVKEHCVLYWKIFHARNMRNIVNLWVNMNDRCCLRCSPSTDTKDGPGIQSVLYKMSDNTMMISLFNEASIQRNQLYYCAHTLNIGVNAPQIRVQITSKKDDSEFYLVWTILKKASDRLCVLCVDNDNNIVDTINTMVYDANQDGTDLIMTPLTLMSKFVAKNNNTRLISMRTMTREIRTRFRTLELNNITNLLFSLKEAGDPKKGSFLKFDIYGVTQDATSFHTIFFNNSQIKHIKDDGDGGAGPVDMHSRFVELLRLPHLNHLLSLLSFSIKSIMTFISSQIAQQLLMSIRYNIKDQAALESLARYYASCDDSSPKKDYDVGVVRELLKKAADIYLCLSYDIVDLGTFHYNIQHQSF